MFGAPGKQAVPSLTYPLRRPFLQAPEGLGYAMICLIAFLPRFWLFFFMSNCEVVEYVKTSFSIVSSFRFDCRKLTSSYIYLTL